MQMTKEQKAVLQSQLNSEKRTLNELKQVYRRALMDCEKKIMELSARTDLENLQSIIYQDTIPGSDPAAVGGNLGSTAVRFLFDSV